MGNLVKAFAHTANPFQKAKFNVRYIMDSTVYHDYLIIGAGPAGIQMGYFLDQEGFDYLILEKSEGPGAFFEKYPRHRKLISINKVYTGTDDPDLNLRWDWNSLLNYDKKFRFSLYSQEYFPSASTYVAYLKEFCEKEKLKIKYNEAVENIEKEGLFRVNTAKAVYTAKYLIISTGVSAPYIPNIEGIEHCDQYTTCSIDPQDYRNKKVLVIGKGNSAFETAECFIETASLIHLLSPNSVELAWKTHFVGHLRALNNNLLDTYQLKSQNALIDGEITAIKKLENEQLCVSIKYGHADGEVEDIIYDKIILCAGFKLDDSIFGESCKPELKINNKFPALKANWESTNIPHLYFAGTLMQGNDYKKCTSAFIHGFRYCVKSLVSIFKNEHHNEDWHTREFQLESNSVSDIIIKRVNKTSALWQLFGFLGHLYVLDREEKKLISYEPLPVKYIHEAQIAGDKEYFIVTLEYGDFPEIQDVFSIPRPHKDDYQNADKSYGLHPIIRLYKEGELISHLHLIENFQNVWKDPVHVNPLKTYLSRIFSAKELFNVYEV